MIDRNIWKANKATVELGCDVHAGERHWWALRLLKGVDPDPTCASRDSGLSFQCMGEQMYSTSPNETAWFRHCPSKPWDGNFSMPRPPIVLSKSMPEARKVESWLSEVSISDDEDDFCVRIPLPHSLPL